MMNFLKIKKKYIKYLIIIFCFNTYCVSLKSVENKIIFKINDKAFTSLDYENRIKYLDFVGNNNDLNQEIIKKNFITVNLFFEYYKKNKMNIELNNKVIEIYDKIRKINKTNNKIYKYEINKDNILLNIKLDYVRKIILERILNLDINNFNNPNEEIDLLYNFKIQYINFKNIINISDKINNLSNINFDNVVLLLRENEINFFTKEKYVNNINEVDKRIKESILYDKDYLIINKNDNLTIVFIEKTFETFEGLVAKLFSVRSKDEINENDLSCNKLVKNINNFNIIHKEYKFQNLNNQLKEELISINDYVKIYDKNNNINIYVILCDIKFDKEILSNFNLNKIINTSVTNIEKNFINKYSKLYNLKVMHE